MSNRQQHRRCWPGRQGRPRVRDSRYYETAGGNKVRPKKIFLFHLLTTTPKPTEQRHGRGEAYPLLLALSLPFRHSKEGTPLCRVVAISIQRGGYAPPRVVAILLQWGGVQALLVCVPIISTHNKEGLRPPHSHSCHVHTARRVQHPPHSRGGIPVNSMQRRGFSTPSPFAFLSFARNEEGSTPSPFCVSSISEQQGGC